MNPFKQRKFLVVCLLLFAFAFLASAQDATIVGTITDPSGAPVLFTLEPRHPLGSTQKPPKSAKTPQNEREIHKTRDRQALFGFKPAKWSRWHRCCL